MDKTTDNNDLTDVRKTCSLIDTISYYKKLCFSSHDVYSIIDCLNNWIVVDIDVSYQSSDLILYTGIRYNNCRLQICQYLESNIIKIM